MSYLVLIHFFGCYMLRFTSIMIHFLALILLDIRNPLKGVGQQEFSFLRPQKGMKCLILVLIKFFGCYMIRFMTIMIQLLALILLVICNPLKGVGWHEFSILRPQKGMRYHFLVLINFFWLLYA